MVLSGLLLPGLAHSDGLPSPCDPRENAAVCEVKVQRNNALDHLAVAEGALRDENNAAERTAEYWKRYVGSLPNGRLLRAHIGAVCRWRGEQSKPAAELCDWWHRTQGLWIGRRVDE